MNVILISACALLLAAIVARVDFRRKSAFSDKVEAHKELLTWFQKESMPPELARSRLLLNEKDVSCTHPIRIHGRPDQVFLSNNNKVIPVDTKTRSSCKVYYGDRVQLSAYAMMLSERYAGKHQVSTHGYIRFVIGSLGIRYVRVRILPGRKIIDLYQQVISIKRHGNAGCRCQGKYHQ